MSFYKRSLLLLVLAGSLLALRFVPFNASGSIKDQRPLMGTIWSIEVVHHGQPQAAQRAIDAAYAELSRIDALMSEWKPESPVSKVNDAAGSTPVEVPEELRALIERSVAYGYQSQGTFDITWRGLGRIWHFDANFVPPTPDAVAAARKNVDFRLIQIQGNRVYLPKHGMNIGLGGIAKGYAIDRATAVIARAGFNDSLVDGGGDVFASGHREDGGQWRVGIQSPRREHGAILGVVEASNIAVVTSGDYERFLIVNGVRYHHIIDPRTGWPASASSSVTIIGASAERAVVLAKPAFILGGQDGLDFARRQAVEALIIDSQGKQYATDGFGALFHQN